MRLVFCFVTVMMLFGIIPAGYAAGVNAVNDQRHMNGISVDQYPEFWKHWHFVTTRYRKDTGELRFVYANDLAWKALLAGTNDYPDGAVFGKVAAISTNDPAFINSVMPSDVMRMQLMVRDHTRYADTHGWGYALFNAVGVVPDDPQAEDNEDELTTTKACNACHMLVPERGYIFAQPMPWMLDKQAASSSISASERLQFATQPKDELPQHIGQLLPADADYVRLVKGEIQNNLFIGTVDELRPGLVHESLAEHMPVALIDPTGNSFIMLTTSTDDPRCKADDHKPVYVAEFFALQTRDGKMGRIHHPHFCTTTE